ncbi:MAG: zinc-binding dehydrogenase, partial [Ectothiorhodospiraceae bacterium]
LVTGASGGVGSFATLLLSRAGYTVTALTGKPDAADYLRGLGAESILAPDELEASGRPLDKARWAGVVDAVGGATLAGLLPTVQPFGTVAAIGLAGGTDLPTTVMPFILRGVSLLGIESVYCPATLRLKTWERIAGVVGTDDLEAIGHTAVGLEAVPEACQRLLDRGVRGRVLVRPDAGAP